MYRFQKSRLQGDYAEARFKIFAQKHGYTVTKTSKIEDMQHKDFYIEKEGKKLSVDVKSMKRISRREEPQDEFFWIEWRNANRGGWLLSDVDMIAFEVSNGFMLCKTKELRELSQKLCDKGFTNTPYDALYKLFTRTSPNGLKATLSLIRRTDITPDVLYGMLC
jgi:hypothetical protein